MLILPQGWQRFQQMNALTDGVEKRKSRRETGFQVTEDVDPGEVKQYKGWALPTNFCADCGRTDIVPEVGLDGTKRLNPGLTEIDEPMPEIDLTVGDVLTYWICHKCMDSENWAAGNIHGPMEKRVYFQERHERRRTNQVEWIKAAKLRGEQPVIGQR